MKKQIARTTLCALCAAAIIVVPDWTRAQGAPNVPAISRPMPQKKHSILFRGNVTALNTNAMTISMSRLSQDDLTLHVTSNTKIARNGQPATLANFAVGEPISGSYNMGADGTNNAVSIHFGTRK
jgi:hypothetical protein